MGFYDVESGKYAKLGKACVVENGKYVKLPKAYIVENGKYVKVWSGGTLQYMASGELGKMYISTDLSTWETCTTPSSNNISKIVFAFGKYFMYNGTRPEVYSSSDGKTWTLCYTVNSTGGATINNICFAGNILFVFKNGNYFAATTDGVNWTESSFNQTISEAWTSAWSVFDIKYGTVGGVTGYYLLYRSPSGYGYLVRWNSGTSITGFNTTAPVRITSSYIFGGSLTKNYCAIDISSDAMFILVKVGNYMCHYKVTGSSATQLYNASTTISNYFTMLPAVNNMLRVSTNNTEMYSKTSATKTSGANMIYYGTYNSNGGNKGNKLGNRVVTSGTSSTSTGNFFLAYTDNDGATWTQSIILTGVTGSSISGTACFYGGDA